MLTIRTPLGPIIFFIICHLFQEKVEGLDLCSVPVDKPKICTTRENYSSNDAPLPRPFLVEPYLEVRDIVDFDQNSNTITIVIRTLLYWNDTSIKITGPNPENVSDWYLVTIEDAREIFHPALNFFKAIKIERYHTFGTERGFTFWLSRDSFLSYEEMLQLKFYCQMNFIDFPFDTHICDVHFFEPDNVCDEELSFLPVTVMYEDQSSNELNTTINVTDSHLPFNIYIEPVAGFHTTNIDFQACTTGVRMTLTRKSLGLLIGGYYLPTAAFSILSMISFFINPDTVPGRMGMLVTLYLIAANVYNSVKAPPGRGFSYIETWMIGTQFPILLALIEYGIVLAWKRWHKEKAKVSVVVSEQRKQQPYKAKMSLDDKIKLIDLATFYLSLAFFVIFNIFYWALVP